METPALSVPLQCCTCHLKKKEPVILEEIYSCAEFSLTSGMNKIPGIPSCETTENILFQCQSFLSFDINILN